MALVKLIPMVMTMSCACVAHESEFRNDHLPQQPYYSWWQRGVNSQALRPPAANLNNPALIKNLRFPKLMPVPEANGARDGDEDRGQQSPSPDLSRYDFHAPPRKSSREGPVPHIVIPTKDIYTSDTPSPLSPITPPDRLSPIEELDDNASLRSKEAVKQNRYQTTAHQVRPTSTEFELDAIAESDDVSLEVRSELLFSRQHLELIFADKELAVRFGSFLRTYRPDSVPILGYYHDTVKALKTLKYAEAVVKSLETIPGLEFTSEPNGVTMTWVLEDKANRVLDVLAKDDLPAFIAYVYVTIVDMALVERVTGKAEIVGNDFAVGLAEVFTISDPSRPDNPLVFASEEFHRMTQYPSTKALGRNCRFLGGPKTDPNAITRIKARRDGSPFINLVMIVPLRDQNGKVRYYLGAQLDITELVLSCTGLESFRKLVARRYENADDEAKDNTQAHVDLLTQFQELSETFSTQELQSLLKSQQRQEMDDKVNHGLAGYQSHSGRVPDSLPNGGGGIQFEGFGSAPPLGFYQNYLLVRPHPSLRILFASPDLRVPGILQSPLMDQLGGSSRVREDLYHALEAGQKVTAKVQWLSKSNQDGRARWIHCTPLISANGLIGVWMVILVDDDEEPPTPMKTNQSEPMPTTNAPTDVPGVTPWDSVKTDRPRHNNEHDRSSPSTSNSSATAVSESGKPVFNEKFNYDKVPPVVKEIPESIPFNFATAKLKPSTTDIRVDAAPLAELDGRQGSNDSLPVLPKSPTHQQHFAPLYQQPPPQQYKGHSPTSDLPFSLQPSYNPQTQKPPQPQPSFLTSADLPFSPAFRPGPRIAGRSYSFVSNSSNNDNNDNGRPGSSRPLSRESAITPMQQSQVQPPDLRWRKPSTDSAGGAAFGVQRGAPVKKPASGMGGRGMGRPSQDSGSGSGGSLGAPMVRKTKKSLSPYGFLFD
ncbi:hypothetical protein Q9189_002682 [Teloschistes chrysophthalmus]